MKRLLILAAILTLGGACAAEESIGIAGTTKVTSTNAEALVGLRTTAGLTTSQISDTIALDAARTTCSTLNSGRQTYETVVDNIQTDTSGDVYKVDLALPSPSSGISGTG